MFQTKNKTEADFLFFVAVKKRFKNHSIEINVADICECNE